MYRVFKIEIKNYLKTPMTIVFLVLPILIYTIASLISNLVTALTVTIFIQTLFIAMFSYGTKVRTYRNKTMIKKISNSNFKLIYPTIVLIFLSIVLLFTTLLMPITYVLVKVDSIGYLDRNQYAIITDAINSGDITNVSEYFINGLTQNYVLFTSNFKMFMQWVFALFIVIGSVFSVSHLIAISAKGDSSYFSITITLFVLIILFSSIPKKTTFILNEDEYTMAVSNIGNKLFIILKFANPFYWVNQLLMNATIADSMSGEYIIGYFPPEAIGVDAQGTFVFQYFNIFHIGTSISTESGIEFNRTVFTSNIELHQILCLVYPSIMMATPMVVSTIRGIN